MAEIRETGNSSGLDYTWTNIFSLTKIRMTNFRANTVYRFCENSIYPCGLSQNQKYSAGIIPRRWESKDLLSLIKATRRILHKSVQSSREGGSPPTLDCRQAHPPSPPRVTFRRSSMVKLKVTPLSTVCVVLTWLVFPAVVGSSHKRTHLHQQ